MGFQKTIRTIALTTLLSLMNPFGGEGYTPLPGRTLTTYEEAKKKIDTPSRTYSFFLTHLDWTADTTGTFTDHTGHKRKVGSDYMQEPIDTYLRGKGDCEDYAALAATWLTSHGYETSIIAFYKQKAGSGHAICAVKENERWSYLGNDGYSKGHESIEALVRSEAPKWAVYYRVLPDQTSPTGGRRRDVIYRNDKQRKIWQYKLPDPE